MEANSLSPMASEITSNVPASSILSRKKSDVLILPKLAPKSSEAAFESILRTLCSSEKTMRGDLTGSNDSKLREENFHFNG